jgi:phage terminase large subunit-like protein
MERWDQCNFEFNPTFLKGRDCYGGLDLSSTNDLTSFVLVFPPEDEDDKYIILPYFWIPGEEMERRVLKDHVQYDQWKANGFLETTEGDVINYNFIQQKIEELAKLYNIREISFDRWGAHLLSQNLDDAGFRLVPFGQGYKSMSPPCKELMRLVLERRIAHGGNPVLRWNFDNMVVKQDEAGNIKPDKEKATEIIVGAVATLMALDRALIRETKGGAYEKHGIVSYGDGGFRGLD